MPALGLAIRAVGLGREAPGRVLRARLSSGARSGSRARGVSGWEGWRGLKSYRRDVPCPRNPRAFTAVHSNLEADRGWIHGYLPYMDYNSDL